MNPPDYAADALSRQAAALLGLERQLCRDALAGLQELFLQARREPALAIRFREWRACLLEVGIPDEEADVRRFVRHTYLALMARFAARYFLEPDARIASPYDLGQTVTGDWHRDQDIDHLVEDDFFTWLLDDAIAPASADLLMRLVAVLAPLDWRNARPGALAPLALTLADSVDDLGLPRGSGPLPPLEWAASPGMRILDPSCGSGEALAEAARSCLAARLAQGNDPFGAMQSVAAQMAGMEANPVAGCLARLNYLLAFGDLARGPRPPLTIPIYLCPPLTEEQRANTDNSASFRVSTAEAGVAFELPLAVASNRQMLHWLFDRMPNYVNAVGRLRHGQTPQERIAEVLGNLRNYLTAPKPRTPIPEPLDEEATLAMLTVGHQLMKLHIEGKDHLWLSLLRNRPAALALSREPFDVVVER